MNGVQAIIADASRAREQRISEAGQGSRTWMITLVDLVSLIMVFFVLLIAMSSIERKTWMELAGKLASSGIVALPSPDSAEPRSANLARSAALDQSRLAYYRKIVLERFRGTPFEADLNVEVGTDGLSVALPARLLGGTDARTQELYEKLQAAFVHIGLPVVVHTEIDDGSASSSASWRRAYEQASAPAARLRRIGLRVPIAVAVTMGETSLLAVIRFVVRHDAR